MVLVNPLLLVTLSIGTGVRQQHQIIEQLGGVDQFSVELLKHLLIFRRRILFRVDANFFQANRTMLALLNPHA